MHKVLYAEAWCLVGLPWWLSGRVSACNAGDAGDMDSILGLERSPRRGYGNPLQYSCLENPMDRGAWQATVGGAAKSRTQLKQLSTRGVCGTLAPELSTGG